MPRFGCGVCINVCEMQANYIAYSDQLNCAFFALKLAFSYCWHRKWCMCFTRVKAIG